jgi:predicted DNA-binding transcriptional regulator YafY
MSPAVPVEPGDLGREAEFAVGDAPVGELSGRLRSAYGHVLAKGELTTQDLMEATGVSHRTALRDLQALVARGLVERVGSRRGAFYRPLASS